MSKALYWFTHDLRLNDNSGVDALLDNHTEVAFMFVINTDWFKPTNYLQKSIGVHRWQFLKSSLENLHSQLRSRGHRLLLRLGKPVAELKQFVEEYEIKQIYTSKQFGFYEQKEIDALKTLLPSVKVSCLSTSTLFNDEQILTEQIPMQSFSAFRKHVETQNFSISEPCLRDSSIWPQPIDIHGAYENSYFGRVLDKVTRELVGHNTSELSEDYRLLGGEQSAISHVCDYFSSSAPLTYKETRNELDGKYNSTKFSPYLAMGNVSPRYIWHELIKYQQSRGKNESTYWIGFELLWREYFQWLLKSHGKSFFLFQGNTKNKPLTSFYAHRFAQWCNGQTKYPLVNACINQLNATGYMSNRGRQIVASCLVNELSVDWRYGAAYFQQQLVDYDVASNWGNWQYIAGVGVDPQGGRHFNISKQTQLYDKNGDFIKKWQGAYRDVHIYDLVNEADWPNI
ncbi:DASH family cryptochrome [Pseudoalteromonas sp. S16_S37]|uniref:DASH family cryptochrome n=1 Tax=Pseudoalteromonas sp. S16_S37 TaxID=2720228 RepID=UPI001681A12E|nr:DASH family cryptochrome [Pseudoalteromonas sp. S16_S37]MBD1584225.1 DASH family cryptochrome [Pseudoalteromonas sp. S16_S37]